MDNPRPGNHQDDENPPMPTEAELRAMMEQSDLDSRTSRGVPVGDVLAKLETAAKRIEARIRSRTA